MRPPLALAVRSFQERIGRSQERSGDLPGTGQGAEPKAEHDV
jgi:hypothetical protein